MAQTIFERSTVSAEQAREVIADAKQVPFWLDETAGTRVPQEPVVGTLTADLAVVGGGYCGLWTAVLAKRANPALNVVLVEAQTVGWAASGRNGGFCSESLTHGYENGVRRWPNEIDELERLGRKNLDQIELAVAELELDCDFERPGSLSVAVEPHQVAWLQEMADGDRNIFLNATEVQEQVNSPTYLAGLWQKGETALIQPAKLAQELARVALDLGVKIYEHSEVEDLSKNGAKIELRTPKGRVQADQVALATNVFPSLLKRNSLMTVPVYDYVLMTEPLTKDQLSEIGWHKRQGLSDVSNQFHYYRMSADNRILWGGYDAIYHYGRKVKASYEDRPATYERLAKNFLTTFPQLDDIRFSHKWAGAIDTCSRFCAFFGNAYGGRVAYAAGFTGLGVASTHFAAKVMLDFLSGVQTERTELEMVKTKPLPFPPEPAAFAGIQASRWSMDKADNNQGKRNLFLKTMDKLGLGFDS